MNILKTAAVAIFSQITLGIIALFYFLFRMVFIAQQVSNTHNPQQFINSFLNITPFIILIYSLSTAAMIISYMGFISLGKKLKNERLVWTSCLLLIFMIIYSVFKILSLMYLKEFLLIGQNPQLLLDNLKFFMIQYLIGIVILAGIIVVMIFFGTALKKEEMKEMKTIGTLFIIAGATLIIGAGWILYLVAMIMAAMLFIKLSRNNRNNYKRN